MHEQSSAAERGTCNNRETRNKTAACMTGLSRHPHPNSSSGLIYGLLCKSVVSSVACRGWAGPESLRGSCTVVTIVIDGRSARMRRWESDENGMGWDGNGITRDREYREGRSGRIQDTGRSTYYHHSPVMACWKGMDWDGLVYGKSSPSPSLSSG
jgi:hypothetical protein